MDSMAKSEAEKAPESSLKTAPESLASDSDYISDSIDRIQSDFDQHDNQQHAMADFWQHGDNNDHEDENALNIETSLPTSDSPLQVRIVVEFFVLILVDWMQRPPRTNAEVYQLKVPGMFRRCTAHSPLKSPVRGRIRASYHRHN